MTAELDVILATGWRDEYVQEQSAEKLIWLHLRWQFNQLRFSGAFGRSSSRSSRRGSYRGERDQGRSDHWRSQTTQNADGSMTMRTNIEDLFNPAVAARINQAGAGR